MRLSPCTAAAFATLAACGGAAADAPADPHALRPGLYETIVSLIEMTPPPPRRLEAFRAALMAQGPQRQCFTAEDLLHRVGETFGDAACRSIEVTYDGARLRRIASCRGQVRAITMSGTRGPDGYDYRITAESPDPSGGRSRIVVTREQGRRIGDCPPEASPEAAKG